MIYTFDAEELREMRYDEVHDILTDIINERENDDIDEEDAEMLDDYYVEVTNLLPILNRRDQVFQFVLDKFGIDIPEEYNDDCIESVDDEVEYFIKRYDLKFNEVGDIVSEREITILDRAKEVLHFYYDYADRSDKEFETLDMALEVLRDLVG